MSNNKKLKKLIEKKNQIKWIKKESIYFLFFLYSFTFLATKHYTQQAIQ